ncbi:MAG: rRNA maturation RNase YbeY [Candidatus Andersenbacteria bacterium]
MPISLQCSTLPLTAKEVEQLWQAVITQRGFRDEVVAIRCISEAEIQQLNATYRGKNQPTNVLTFSYGQNDTWPGHDSDAHHDVPLCLAVAKREAAARGLKLKDYAALLLVHAFLHITGMDHERSDQEALSTAEAERAILTTCGFSAVAW